MSDRGLVTKGLREMALGLVRLGLISLTLTIMVGVLSLPRATAQVLFGSIAGSVRDSTNAPVPGAAIRITNVATNQSRESASNDSGEFSFASLEAGAYNLTVKKEGFQAPIGASKVRSAKKNLRDSAGSNSARAIPPRKTRSWSALLRGSTNADAVSTATTPANTLTCAPAGPTPNSLSACLQR